MGRADLAAFAATEAATALESQDAKDLAAMARALEVKAALAAGDKTAARTTVSISSACKSSAEGAKVRPFRGMQ